MLVHPAGPPAPSGAPVLAAASRTVRRAASRARDTPTRRHGKGARHDSTGCVAFLLKNGKTMRPSRPFPAYGHLRERAAAPVSVDSRSPCDNSLVDGRPAPPRCGGRAILHSSGRVRGVVVRTRGQSPVASPLHPVTG
jgi:hypothetical protein